MNGSSENLTFSEEFKCSIFLPYCEEKQRSWRYNFGLKKKKQKNSRLRQEIPFDGWKE